MKIQGNNFFSLSLLGIAAILFLQSCNQAGSSTKATTTTGVTSGTKVSLTPASVYQLASSSQTLTASGGSAPYTFAVVSGGGSVTSGGVFTAPATAATCVVRVTEKGGATTTTTINVYVALSTFAASTIAVGDTESFSITGGVSPYTFTLTTGSGTASMSNSTTGLFTPSSSTGVSTVTVADTIGNTSVASITVVAYPTISGGLTSISNGMTTTFTKAGGVTSTSFSVVAGGAGGTIDASTGVYTPPLFATGVDTIKVTDTIGNVAQTSIAVTSAIKRLGGGGVYDFCGISKVTTGQLQCWGYNGYGELGDGSTTESHSPLNIFTGVTYAQTSMGSYHSCAITTGGALHCWGDNSHNQIDSSAVASYSVPTIVDSGVSYSMVSSGYYHTCGVTTGGTLRCWGYNAQGQVGNGTTVDVTAPTTIDGGNSYQYVSAGDFQTCAITTGGILKCWGYNNYGQVGNGSNVNVTSPATIYGGIILFKSVSVATYNGSGSHVCAISTTNALYCWGRNDHGQIGNNASGGGLNSFPQAINAGTNYGFVSSGGLSTCATTTAGALYCWGYNGTGQLGLGNNTEFHTPQSVDNTTTYVAIKLNAYYSACGITSTNAFKCWGYNNHGQLGIGTIVDSWTPVAIP